MRKILLAFLIVLLIINCPVKAEASDGELEDVIWHTLPDTLSDGNTYNVRRIEQGVVSYSNGISSVLVFTSDKRDYWYEFGYRIKRLTDGQYEFYRGTKFSRDYEPEGKYIYNPNTKKYYIICKNRQGSSTTFRVYEFNNTGSWSRLSGNPSKNPEDYSYTWNGISFHGGDPAAPVFVGEDGWHIYRDGGYKKVYKQAIFTRGRNFLNRNYGRFYDSIYAFWRHIAVGTETDQIYGAPSYPVTYISSDGNNWQKRLSSHTISQVLLLNGNLVGRNGRNIYTSNNEYGDDWELRMTAKNDIVNYFYYNNQLWFVTNDWRFYSSSDGKFWSERKLDPVDGYSLKSAGYDGYNLVVEVDKHKTIGIVPGRWLFDANASPGIIVNQPKNNSSYKYNDTLVVSGSVKDENIGDNLSIKYTINGSTTHTNKVIQNITANGQIQNFSAQIKLDGDIPGRPASLVFWVEDDKGGVSNKITINNINFIHPSQLIGVNISKNDFINDEEILLSGRIKDVNVGKGLQLKYTIAGVPGHTNTEVQMINPQVLVSNGGFLDFQAKIKLDSSIPTNEYVLNLWVEDDKGGVSNTYRTDISIKSILYLIQGKLAKYIPQEKVEDIRSIVINTDNIITSNNENDTLISKISNKIKQLDSNIFFIGKDGDTRNYIESNLTNDFRTSAENYILPHQVNSSYLLNYILEKHNESERAAGDVYLTGDYLTNEMEFIDIEKDYADININDKLKDNSALPVGLKNPKKDSLKIRYTHNPNIFDNPEAIHSKGNNVWRVIESMKDSFIIDKALPTMRGEWTLSIWGSDDTKNPAYDKYSDVKTVSFIIHEKPVAKIKMHEDEEYIYLDGSESYDIDFQYSLPNKGIVEYIWEYQLEDGTWIKYPENSKILLLRKDKKITTFRLTVKDCYGASDEVNSAYEEVLDVEPYMDADLEPEIKEYDIKTGIPAGVAIKVFNIETLIPGGVDRLEFSLYSGTQRVAPVKQLIYPNDIVNSDEFGLNVEWKDIRNYIIPEGLEDDKIYTARLDAIKRNDRIISKEWNILVVTPLEIDPGSDKDVYRAGQALLLNAKTTGGAYKVETRMWYPHNEYTETNITSLQPDDRITEPPQKEMTWHSRRTKEEGRDIVVIIPLKTPDGIYPITFTAYKKMADGDDKTATETIYIKVQGTIYDDSYSEIIGPLK